jgi:hypothetical protein
MMGGDIPGINVDYVLIMKTSEGNHMAMLIEGNSYLSEL